MTSDKGNPNGSVDLLAKAMRQVFKEAVEEGTKPLREDVSALKTDVENGFAELRPPK